MVDAIKIKKILEAGKVVYPATILDAVKDAKSVKVEGVETNKWYGFTLRDILVDEDTTLKGLVSAEEAARLAQVGNLGKVKDANGDATETDHTVKSYVDAAIAAVNGDASTLGGRVEALEGLHDTKTVGDGENAKEVFKTVAEEVNEAVVALVDGAPEALNTLKEIADWISEQDENGEEGAAQLVSKIEKNAAAIEAEEAARKAQIGELGKVSDEEGAADHTVQSYVDAAVADLNTTIEGLDVTNNISDAVAGITVTVDEADGIVQTPVVAVTAAEVTFTAAAEAEGVETPAKLEADDVDLLLDGSALAAIKQYVDDRFSTEACTDTADYDDVF